MAFLLPPNSCLFVDSPIKSTEIYWICKCFDDSCQCSGMALLVIILIPVKIFVIVHKYGTMCLHTCHQRCKHVHDIHPHYNVSVIESSVTYLRSSQEHLFSLEYSKVNWVWLRSYRMAERSFVLIRGHKQTYELEFVYIFVGICLLKFAAGHWSAPVVKCTRHWPQFSQVLIKY